MKNEAWLKSLRSGDYVVDCRNQRLRILRIMEQHKTPSWLIKLLYWAPKVVLEVAMKMAETLGLQTHYDSELILEDGSHCSAMNCLQQHNPKAKNDEHVY